MIATVLTAAFVLAAFAAILVLSDCSLRWWSAFSQLRAKANAGHGLNLVPVRIPAKRGKAHVRTNRVYAVIRQTERQAA